MTGFQISQGSAPTNAMQLSGFGDRSDIDLDNFCRLSPDMLCVLGLDGYFKVLHPMWAKVLGFPLKQFSQQPWLEWVHPEDLPETLEKLHALLMQGESVVVFKNRYRCCDRQTRSYRWLSWKITFSESERLIYAAVRDLGIAPEEAIATAESAWCSIPVNGEPHHLSTSEAHFRLLVESVRDYAIYMLDEHGRVISWNAGAERTSGYAAAEVLDRPFSIFFPDRDVQAGKPAAMLQRAREAGSFEDETWRMRKNSSRFWANVLVTALKNERGVLIGYAVLTRDITERKEAADALQQAHDSLEKRVQERTAELLATNVRLWGEIQTRRSTEAALRQSQACLKQQTTELEQALRRLQSTQMQLIQTEKMSGLGQLVAGVAHEINNPMNFIYGNIDHASHYVGDLVALLQLYRKHYPDPVAEVAEAIAAMDLEFLLRDTPKIFESMHVGAERIRDIIQNLRNFSRHDQAKLKTVDICEGIDSTLLILQHRLKARPGCKDIRVVKEYGTLPLVECYANQLNQVFMNILSNAIDAVSSLRLEDDRPEVNRENDRANGHGAIAHKEPSIWIRTQTRKRTVQICIADNGDGIADSVRQRIFDPFYTTKPVGQGTGLGLSISYQIVVEHHGGELHCFSTPGKGTEFVIEIPLCQPKSRSRHAINASLDAAEDVEGDGMEVPVENCPIFVENLGKSC